jgi:hypothetical protein
LRSSRFACPTAHAQDTEKAAADPWLGCWTRIYDAAHLAKHPGQQVTQLTLSISEREPSGDKDPGKYLATITATMRNGGDTYTNLDGARCSEANGNLTCTTDGFYLGQFSLEPAAKNMKIALRGGDHLALIPGVDLDAFVMLSPDNPQHALFLLQPAPTKTCGS